MTEEEYFRKNYPDSCYGDKPLSPHWDFFQDGVEFGERQSEKKIAELEKENAELKNRLEHRNCLDCSNHSSKLRMRTLELEKENAELKEKYAKNITDCDICDTYCNSQLTKAKELLKRYVPYRQITDSKAYKDLAEETEQFLNSEVEK